jgi:hypothetical protein
MRDERGSSSIIASMVYPFRGQTFCRRKPTARVAATVAAPYGPATALPIQTLLPDVSRIC